MDMIRVSIDFGSSRTQMAIQQRGTERLVPLFDRYYVSSQCFVDASGKAFFGASALDQITSDKQGQLLDNLKGDLFKPYIGLSPRIKPVDILMALFRELLEVLRQTPEMAGRLFPDALVLTFPANVEIGNLEFQANLRAAAELIGFQNVSLLEEPYAVAAAWCKRTGQALQDMIVLDCGGRTTNWTYLGVSARGKPMLSANFPADSIAVGGDFIDRALLDVVYERAGVATHEYLDSRCNQILARLQELKVLYCSALNRGVARPANVMIKNEKISVSAEVFSEIFTHYFNVIIARLKKFVSTGPTAVSDTVPIVLAGGASSLPGLAPALSAALGREVMCWCDQPVAVVLGALTARCQ